MLRPLLKTLQASLPYLFFLLGRLGRFLALRSLIGFLLCRFDLFGGFDLLCCFDLLSACGFGVFLWDSFGCTSFGDFSCRFRCGVFG